MLMDSWRPNSLKQYTTYLRKWNSYCGLHNIDATYPSIGHVLDFMADCYQSGLGYSAMNSVRSALSATLPNMDNYSVGAHPLVKRLMKGIFERQPVLPRYTEIWDIEQVLQFLRGMPDYEHIGLKELTLKTVMLLALATGQRRQSLQSLRVSSVHFTDSTCRVEFPIKLKTTKPGKHQAPIMLRAFADSTTCVVRSLRAYLTKTSPLRVDDSAKQDKQDALFLSYHKPHQPVSLDTISRYLKTVLNAAGVDTKYTPHSTRSASTSAALAKGTAIDAIMQCAGWKQESTFVKFYRRDNGTEQAQPPRAAATGLL